MKKKLDFMVDLDGVVCDWVTAAYNAVGRPDLIGTWPVGTRKFQDAVGMSSNETHRMIDAMEEKFWRGIPDLPWFRGLMDLLNSYGEVTFCTSPSLSAEASKGKVLWLQDRFGKHFRDYIITSKKHKCAAGKHTVLIDDTQEKIDDFKDAGGSVILFPQPWNKKGSMKDPLPHIEEEIKKILKVA